MTWLEEQDKKIKEKWKQDDFDMAHGIKPKTNNMDNKYYTPELREFHPGFEFEALGIIDSTQSEWKVYIFNFQFDKGALEYLIEKKGIRVKCLSKECIESLGWETTNHGHVAYYCYTDSRVDTSNPNALTLDGEFVSSDYWELHYREDKALLFDLNNEVIFKEMIGKNKSELKTLLIQAGVPTK